MTDDEALAAGDNNDDIPLQHQNRHLSNTKRTGGDAGRTLVIGTPPTPPLAAMGDANASPSHRYHQHHHRLSTGSDDDGHGLRMGSLPLLPLHHHDDHVGTIGMDDERGLMMAGAPPPPLVAMSDIPWAVAFTVNVAITLLSALYFLPDAMTVLKPIFKTRGWEASDEGVLWVFMTCFFVGASAVAVSSAVLFLSRCMTCLQIALGVYVLMLVTTLWTLPDDLLGPVGSILPVVGVLLSCCFLGQSRIHFAAENLRVASLYVTSTPQITTWAVCATAARYMWHAVGIVAFVGSITAFSTAPDPDGTASSQTGRCQGPWVIISLWWECWETMIPGFNDTITTVSLTCFWIASVLWSSAVGASVVAATVADSVASQWSSPGNVGTAWESCHRVVHSSLGSLCKVAALDCLSCPLRFIVGRLSHASWVANAIMLFVQFTVSYVLLQPVFFISIYKLNFAEALRHTRAMFRTHGRTLLVNDSMLLAGLSFLCAVVSALPTIATLYWVVGNLWSSPPSPSVVGIVFFCTMIVIFATLEALLYGVKAVFVCLVQVPESLADEPNRSRHDDLHKAWRELQLLHPPRREPRGEIQV